MFQIRRRGAQISTKALWWEEEIEEIEEDQYGWNEESKGKSTLR